MDDVVQVRAEDHLVEVEGGVRPVANEPNRSDNPLSAGNSSTRPESERDTEIIGDSVVGASEVIAGSPETEGGNAESQTESAEATGESSVADTSQDEDALSGSILPDGELPGDDTSDDDTSDDDDDGPAEHVEPLEEIKEEVEEEELKMLWYILKVQVNREDSIRDALERRVKIEGLEECFGQIIVPTEDVVEFTKTGRKRIVKRKLYPGYILVYMLINDDTWFLVRETPGIGDFTGSAGKPTPMLTHEVERILKTGEKKPEEEGPRVDIPFDIGDRVRIKDGNFQNFEGDVDAVDESNGRVTVMINIFGRSTPVEFEHWQIEKM